MMHSSDAMVHKRIKAQLADDLRFVEQHAFALRGADERFLLGSEFSAADIAFYPWFEQLCVLEKYLGFVMPTECERLLRWQETVAAREAVRTCARSPGFYLESYGPLLAALRRAGKRKKIPHYGAARSVICFLRQAQACKYAV
ncbi:glutathione S-transferase C-terminal domain-containing protein [Mesorhizobium sp. L103C131B0]|uniref:glutathione S-transferase C-terminal domain-containing protein n=1 Tax=Mesorhizobium sp. L103C131B0 TaxID=1287089 RepID=UPI0003CF9FC5|nr:glutathione S-transferase C-terminal domain-containing protein [Mesorhizobium sp. L103C131B0]ESZ60950.1 hypothetical protein X729_15295 [Mesorhizobium sp. L103C131B0]